METFLYDVLRTITHVYGSLYSVIGEEDKNVVKEVLKKKSRKLSRIYEGNLIQTLVKGKKFLSVLHEARRVGDTKTAELIENEVATQTGLFDKLQEIKNGNLDLSNEINDIIIGNDLVSFSKYLTPDYGVSVKAVKSPDMLRACLNVIYFHPEDTIKLYYKFNDIQGLDTYLESVDIDFDDIYLPGMLRVVSSRRSLKHLLNFIKQQNTHGVDNQELIDISLNNKNPNITIELIEILNPTSFQLFNDPKSIHPDVLEYLIDKDLIEYPDMESERISLTKVPSQRLIDKIQDLAWWHLFDIQD